MFHLNFVMNCGVFLDFFVFYHFFSSFKYWSTCTIIEEQGPIIWLWFIFYIHMWTLPQSFPSLFPFDLLSFSLFSKIYFHFVRTKVKNNQIFKSFPRWLYINKIVQDVTYVYVCFLKVKKINRKERKKVWLSSLKCL